MESSNRAIHISYPWMVRSTAALMLAAGITHLAIIPQQWGHAPAHGIFMGVSGIIEILWAVLFLRKPTKLLVQAGMLIAVALIFLWVITRVSPAPFTGTPEEVDLAGIVSKLLEGASAAALAGVFLQMPQFRDPGATARHAVITLVLIGLFLGLAAYEVSLAAQPFFPGLASTESHGSEHSHDINYEAP